MSSGVFAEPNLIGRERELKELYSLLKLAAKGKGKTVFISGEAGSGKTRLITYFLKEAKKQEINILTGWCLSNAAIPYFPFVEAFNAYFSKHKKEKYRTKYLLTQSQIANETKITEQEELELESWLLGSTQPGKSGKIQALSPQMWKDQTFAAVAKTLSFISSRRLTIFFIDDLHWADSASLALTNYLARKITSEKVLMIATFRSEQISDDASGTKSLAETLRLMRREDLFKEIKISSLSRTDVYDLAKNMLGGELQPEFAENLARESQGNPLFVVESLRMLHERRSLTKEDDKWRLTHDEIRIPAKIKDIILLRLDTLAKNQRNVLDAASVIGERFDFELLASVMDLDPIETVRILDAIAEHTSLISCQEEIYRFDHARSQDTIYNEISSTLRRQYHGKIAEELEKSCTNSKLPYSDLAYHFAKAHNKKKAAKYALIAGKDALMRWSSSEAIKHLTYAVAAFNEDQYAENKLTALEALGDAFYAHGLFKKATKTFKELSNAAEENSAKLRAFRKVIESSLQEEDITHLTKMVEKAKQYFGTNGLEQARILIAQGRAFALQDKTSIALEDFQAALQVFEEEYALWDVAWTLVGVGAFKMKLGMKQEGIFASLRAIALLGELDLESRWPKEEYYVVGITASININMLEQLIEEIRKVRQATKDDFEHSNLKANLTVRRNLFAGEEFELRLDLVNIGRKRGLLVEVSNLLPPTFKVVAIPSWCSVKKESIDLKMKQIDGLDVETIKLTLKAVETGTFTLNPCGVYVDDLGERKKFGFNHAELVIKPEYPAASSRITSGFNKLDNLLLGGIPKNYAIVLASPSSNERELLLKRFLEAGTKACQATFDISANVGKTKEIAELYQSNLYLFVCNPRADALIGNLPNVFKLKGVDNLTQIDISLTKAFRYPNVQSSSQKRACIEILSDVLLQHHAIVTRKWLSALLADFKSQKFTVLAVIDPNMHSQEEVQAITDLFDGEIRIFERQSENRLNKILKILKLYNEDYLEDELSLTRESLKV
jgi:tetratricopeptide (TPR) repeat protein